MPVRNSITTVTQTSGYDVAEYRLVLSRKAICLIGPVISNAKFSIVPFAATMPESSALPGLRYWLTMNFVIAKPCGQEKAKGG
jgi:hypothetical protein